MGRAGPRAARARPVFGSARARYGPGPLAITWAVGLARLEILDFGPGPARARGWPGRAMDKFPTISVRPGTARV